MCFSDEDTILFAREARKKLSEEIELTKKNVGQDILQKEFTKWQNIHETLGRQLILKKKVF